MKKLIGVVAVVLFASTFLITQVVAQRTSAYGKKPNATPTTTPTTPPANVAPAATQQIPATSKYNNKAGAVQQTGNQNIQATPATVPPPIPAVDTIPVEYDTAGSISKPEILLRNPYATDRSQNRDRRPLEYEHLREDDNMWSEFIWREIDAREKMNQTFTYPGTDDNGDRRFFSILLNAIKYDSVVAFDDEMFTRPFTTDKVLRKVNGKIDTFTVNDFDGSIKKRTISFKPDFPLDSVYTFRLKEQVVFDKEASRLFTRIIGIAPVAKRTIAGRSEPYTLFWLYYPDLRKTFARIDVYNPKNFSSRMTWEELFESRYFSSYITKSSANNPQFLDLLQMFGGDKLRRLYEGNNIKNRIFDFEQDLWQY